MNFGNESSTTGGPILESQTMHNRHTLRPEEVAMYKKCGQEMYFKIGLPLAVVCEVVASYFTKDKGLNKITPQTLLFRGFRFLGNVIIGRFLGTPICYSKLVAMRAEFLKNNPEFEDQSIITPERAQPLTQPKDLSYPPQVSNLDDLEGSFSPDFNTSKLISEDSESVKTPKTTYQELRARHRSGHEGYRGPPSNLQSAPSKPGIDSTPHEKPVYNEFPSPTPRVVRKTKYGDEME